MTGGTFITFFTNLANCTFKNLGFQYEVSTVICQKKIQNIQPTVDYPFEQLHMYLYYPQPESIDSSEMKYFCGIRGISLKVFRVDKILEVAVGVQEYKNSVNPGPHI